MDIILLHGALATSNQLLPLQRELQRSATVHLFDFPGHGLVKKHSFSMETLVDILRSFIEKNISGPINIFGYSMGGYAALSLAAEWNVNKVITLGTKLTWNPAAAEKEMRMLQPGVIQTKVPSFASALEAVHGADWAELVRYTATMMQGLGENPLLNEDTYKKISARVLLMRGTEDNMVSEEESRYATLKIPGAHYIGLPGVPHTIEKSDPLMLADKVLEFCRS